MNTATINVVPAAGRRVRHPDGRLLADKGDHVTDASYWQRRLADGDIELGKAK